MKITERIKRMRLNRDFSQDYVATKLGIGQRAYSKLENGELKIDIEKLQRIAQILEVDAAEIISNEDNQTNNFSNNKITNAVVNHFADEQDKFKKEIVNTLKEEILSLKNYIKEKDKQIQTLINIINK